MEKSKAAGSSPQMVQLESGKTYAWCACGRSSNQPWCDGSHQVTSITPTVIIAKESETRAMCMCKQTKNPPFCDGSHLSLGD
jgi:CDGSH-type Zn-finger protein